MLQTTLTFSSTPNKQELLKEMQEDFPVEVKLSLENCIDINHGVVNCNLILSDKEIVISTTQEGISIKMRLLTVFAGLVGLFVTNFMTGYKFGSLYELGFTLVVYIVGALIIASILPTFPGEPSKVKLHKVVVDFLKEDYGGEDSQ